VLFAGLYSALKGRHYPLRGLTLQAQDYSMGG